MPANDDALLGQRVGNYQLVRSLGVGGMGAVYLGENPKINSRVAIKVLLPRFVGNEHVTRRFFDEARAVNHIGHAGIVRIHDCGQQQGVGVFLVMELLEGRTLDEQLHTDGTFSQEQVVRLLRQTASALTASHQAGIIHRDLKPSNLFVVPDPEVPGGERVKVLDFGIAKLLEDSELSSHEATQTGMVLGSLLFMSPEQSVDTKNVDRRTDIYSLGAIGYHLLSGAVPFEAETLGQLVLKQQQGEPKPLRSLAPEVSEQLAAVIHRALAIDLDERYASMDELRAALDELVEVPVGSPSPRRPVPNPVSGIDAGRGTTLSETAGELVKLGAGGGRRLLIGGALALLLVGSLVTWRVTRVGSVDGADPGPREVAGAAGSGPAPAARPPDVKADARPDLAALDLRALDVVRPAERARRKPRRGPAKVSPRPRQPANKAHPKGPQDGEKDKGSQPYFNKL